jgi:hypothetical protein
MPVCQIALFHRFTHTAVDELVRRLAHGVEYTLPNGQKERIRPNVLRLGQAAKVRTLLVAVLLIMQISPDCRSLSLDFKVAARISALKSEMEKANKAADDVHVSLFIMKVCDLPEKA